MTDLQKIKDALSNQDPAVYKDGHWLKLKYQIKKTDNGIELNVMPEKIVFFFTTEGRLERMTCWKY